MPTPTYDLIATTTLAASTSEVVFGSLPSTYRDLICVMSGTTSSDVSVRVTFNGDTGSNYTRVFIYGQGSSPLSGSGTDQRPVEIGTTQSNFVLQVMDYSATDKHKTTLARSNQASRIVWANTSRWANTAAITSITLDPDSTVTFASGTTISIYGVIS